MVALLVVVVVGLLVIAFIVGRPWWRGRLRRARAVQPFAAEWSELLRQRVPVYRTLPLPIRQQLHGVIANLIAEKQFIGCAGLIVNDEMRLVIAAQAALLRLNRSDDPYPEVRSILVYPDRFFADHQMRDIAGVQHRERRLLSGESWEFGKVVVSWRDVTDGAADPDDGYNVVLHEFAHALDHETGSANGLPLLPATMNRNDWHRILSDAYERLCREVDAGRHTLIDPYGAESPAEFFAVATETFFELPMELHAREPELYRQLALLYRVDPVSWGVQNNGLPEARQS